MGISKTNALERGKGKLNQWIVYAALACCCVLPAHSMIARQRGWPTGAVFAHGSIPTIVSILCILALLACIGFGIYSGAASWWTLLWAVIAYFAGGPILWALLGANAGLLSLIAAPVLTLFAIFMQ